ncbi:MAG: hypothetical protein AAFO04_01160 [Cyanobacteria bacterium J06592_8]
MQSAFHQKVKVLPGNKIEIEHSELPVDETVDVFVLLPKKSAPEPVNILELLAEIHSHRSSTRSPEEIDQYIREEREAWDS